jgi:hypothetical protein
MGTARDNSGTPRSVKINGVSYRVAADVDLSQFISNCEVESIATSGAPMYKYTKRNEDIESIDLTVNADERKVLKGVAESLDSVTLSFTTAARDTYDGVGRISLDAHTHADNKMPIKMLPEDGWQDSIGE